jgi:antitoxin FitA
MPSLVVRNLDDAIIDALKARAVQHRRSTEAEHRAILAEVLTKPKRKSFAEALLNIPNVGKDTHFQRVNEELKAPNVFD